MSPARYAVDRAACIRCAACSSLAPTLFAVDATAARLVRQPETAAERALVTAALLNCPAAAIAATPPRDAEPA
jgi:ferredoxin